jgi:hypothetical protein
MTERLLTDQSTRLFGGSYQGTPITLKQGPSCSKCFDAES